MGSISPANFPTQSTTTTTAATTNSATATIATSAATAVINSSNTVTTLSSSPACSVANSPLTVSTNNNSNSSYYDCEPPFLAIGTEVSAKYKGAFCEAKIKNVTRLVKCRLLFKNNGGSVMVNDEFIKGPLKVGATVEAKHPDKNVFMEATISKIIDASQYTVVFDDADEATLRRTSLCLKSGKHFAESESLDHLPLTNPEHFGNPVNLGLRGRRSRRRTAAAAAAGINSSSASYSSITSDAEDNESAEGDGPPTTISGASLDDDDSASNLTQQSGSIRDVKDEQFESELILPVFIKDASWGKVVCVEYGDKRGNKSKDAWFPSLVVSPYSQESNSLPNQNKDEYFVKSFKDGRFYSVAKKDAKEFTKELVATLSENNCSAALRLAIEKANTFIAKDELPGNWDYDLLLGNIPPSSHQITPVHQTLTSASSNLDNESGLLSSEYESEEDIDEDNNDNDVNEERDRFVAQLYKYMDERGTPINKAPTVASKELDFYKLYRLVTKMGGYNRVTNKGLWRIVYGRMSLPLVSSSKYEDVNSESSTAMSINQLKLAYKKYLHSFDDFYRKLGCTIPMNSRSSSRLARSERTWRHRSMKNNETQPTKTRRKKNQPSEQEKKSDEQIPLLSSLSSSSSSSSTTITTTTSSINAKEKTESKSTAPEKSSCSPASAPSTQSADEEPTKSFSGRRISRKNLKSTRGNKKVNKASSVADDNELIDENLDDSIINADGSDTDEDNQISSKTIPKDEVINVGDRIRVWYGKGKQLKIYEAKILKEDKEADYLKRKYFVHYTGWNTRYDEWIERNRMVEVVKDKSPKRRGGKQQRNSKLNTTPAEAQMNEVKENNKRSRSQSINNSKQQQQQQAQDKSTETKSAPSSVSAKETNKKEMKLTAGKRSKLKLNLNTNSSSPTQVAQSTSSANESSLQTPVDDADDINKELLDSNIDLDTDLEQECISEEEKSYEKKSKDEKSEHTKQVDSSVNVAESLPEKDNVVYTHSTSKEKKETADSTLLSTKFIKQELEIDTVQDEAFIKRSPSFLVCNENLDNSPAPPMSPKTENKDDNSRPTSPNIDQSKLTSSQSNSNIKDEEVNILVKSIEKYVSNTLTIEKVDLINEDNSDKSGGKSLKRKRSNTLNTSTVVEKVAKVVGKDLLKKDKKEKRSQAASCVTPEKVKDSNLNKDNNNKDSAKKKKSKKKEEEETLPVEKEKIVKNISKKKKIQLTPNEKLPSSSSLSSSITLTSATIPSITTTSSKESVIQSQLSETSENESKSLKRKRSKGEIISTSKIEKPTDLSLSSTSSSEGINIINKKKFKKELDTFDIKELKDHEEDVNHEVASIFDDVTIATPSITFPSSSISSTLDVTTQAPVNEAREFLLCKEEVPASPVQVNSEAALSDIGNSVEEGSESNSTNAISVNVATEQSSGVINFSKSTCQPSLILPQSSVPISARIEEELNKSTIQLKANVNIAQESPQFTPPTTPESLKSGSLSSLTPPHDRECGTSDNERTTSHYLTQQQISANVVDYELKAEQKSLKQCSNVASDNPFINKSDQLLSSSSYVSNLSDDSSSVPIVTESQQVNNKNKLDDIHGSSNNNTNNNNRTNSPISGSVSPKKRRKGRKRTCSTSEQSQEKKESRVAKVTRGATLTRRTRYQHLFDTNSDIFTSNLSNEMSPLSSPSVTNMNTSNYSANAFIYNVVPTSKYNFCTPIDENLDAEKRIQILTERLQELKKTYLNIKSEVSSLERRRKKAKKKDRDRQSPVSSTSSAGDKQQQQQHHHHHGHHHHHHHHHHHQNSNNNHHHQQQQQQNNNSQSQLTESSNSNSSNTSVNNKKTEDNTGNNVGLLKSSSDQSIDTNA